MASYALTTSVRGKEYHATVTIGYKRIAYKVKLIVPIRKGIERSRKNG